MAAGLLFVVLFLWSPGLLAFIIPGNLQLNLNDPVTLSGSFEMDGVALSFFSQPGGLTLLSNGNELLKFVDYGAFVRVQFPQAVFLMAATDHRFYHSVLDISTKSVELPEESPSFVHDLEDNLDRYRDLILKRPKEELIIAERRMIGLMTRFTRTEEAETVPYLSIALAARGISGATHASSLPIHLLASRIAERRKELTFDSVLIDRVNNLQSNGTVEGGCSLSNTCGNPCFGMCGPGCTCWSWTCGTCECYIGCKQHDCCCSCLGMTSLCCVNVVNFRCSGYDNPCKPSEETELELVI